MSKVGINIRYAHDMDVDFITSSWLKSFRDGYFNATVPNRVYFTQHHKILENLLPTATVLVACNAEKPDQILGWMCYQVDGKVCILHYIYVKDLMRGHGIAQRLFDYVMTNQSLNLAQNVVMTTHQTHKSKRFIKGNRANLDRGQGARKPYNERHPERPIEWIYNPYALFYKLPEGWERAE